MRLGLLLLAMLALALASWPVMAQGPAQAADATGFDQAIGTGRISLDGDPRSFSIDIRSMTDGSVTGHATVGGDDLERDATRWTIDGVVVEDHVAYVCCINDTPADPWFGTRWAFRAVDNRADGTRGPDQLSLPRGPVLLSCDHPEFLEFRQAIDDAPLHDVDAGDIAVGPR